MGNGNRGNIMIIKNGLVFTPEGKFEKKDLYVEGEYVAKETTDNKEVEAEGCYVIPGLVDIHFMDVSDMICVMEPKNPFRHWLIMKQPMEYWQSVLRQ